MPNPRSSALLRATNTTARLESLELGAGFAYVGRQVPLQVGERDFFLDLLFYHVRLHCYVVVELKTVDFEPEFAGKLNFYLKAVDEQLRSQHDSPTIGLLLCKSKDKLRSRRPCVTIASNDRYQRVHRELSKKRHFQPHGLSST